MNWKKIVIAGCAAVLVILTLFTGGCGKKEVKKTPTEAVKPTPKPAPRPVPKVSTRTVAEWQELGRSELHYLRQGKILGHASRLKEVLMHIPPKLIDESLTHGEMYKYLAQEAALKMKAGDFSQMHDIEKAIERYRVPSWQISRFLVREKVVYVKQKPSIMYIKRPAAKRPISKLRHVAKTKVVAKKQVHRKPCPPKYQKRHQCPVVLRDDY